MWTHESNSVLFSSSRENILITLNYNLILFFLRCQSKARRICLFRSGILRNYFADKVTFSFSHTASQMRLFLRKFTSRAFLLGKCSLTSEVILQHREYLDGKYYFILCLFHIFLKIFHHRLLIKDSQTINLLCIKY